MRGYCGIGIFNPKYEINLGVLWRSAYNLHANFIFTIGSRYSYQSGDTLKTWKQIPLFQYTTIDDLLNSKPKGAQLIGIEQTNDSRDIINFIHPRCSVYLLGAEDSGLPNHIQQQCSDIIHIPTKLCMNVSVAGATILYDRLMKSKR